MAFRKVKGKTRVEWLPVTTSTAFTKNTLVEFTSNLVDPADDNDTTLAGVIEKTIASTDSDYASSRLVPVIVPVEKLVVWECDNVSGGSLAVGGEYGISAAGTIDSTDTTNKVFLCTKVISATKAQGYLKIQGAY